MITYTTVTTTHVRLDGKKVGEIRQLLSGGFYYKPSGRRPGDTFATLNEVKRSIEDND